jgi:nicotinic acid mononucleotide adenylyltransferase
MKFLGSYRDMPKEGHAVIAKYYEDCKECLENLQSFKDLEQIYPSVIFLIESHPDYFAEYHTSHTINKRSRFSIYKDGKQIIHIPGSDIRQLIKTLNITLNL